MTIKQIEAVKDAVLNDGEKRPKIPENGACEYFIGGVRKRTLTMKHRRNAKERNAFARQRQTHLAKGANAFLGAK